MRTLFSREKILKYSIFTDCQNQFNLEMTKINLWFNSIQDNSDGKTLSCGTGQPLTNKNIFSGMQVCELLGPAVSIVNELPD